MMNLAIRGAVDDMVGILESGGINATTFLIGEIERLFDWTVVGLRKDARVGGLPESRQVRNLLSD